MLRPILHRQRLERPVLQRQWLQRPRLQRQNLQRQLLQRQRLQRTGHPEWANEAPFEENPTNHKKLHDTWLARP